MNLQDILRKARELIARGAPPHQVAEMIFRETEGKTADVDELQAAVSEGRELVGPETPDSPREALENITAAVKGGSSAVAEFLKANAGRDPSLVVGGMLARGITGAAESVVRDPVGAAKAVGSVFAGNPLEVFGPETALTAFGPFARAARKAAEAAGDIAPTAVNFGTGAERAAALAERQARPAGRLDELVPPPRGTGAEPPDFGTGLERTREMMRRQGLDEAEIDVELKRLAAADNQATALKPPVEDVPVPPARTAAAMPSGLVLSDNAEVIAQLGRKGGTFDPRTGKSFGGEDVWAVATKQPGGSPHGQLFDEPPSAFEVREYLKKHSELLESDADLVVGTWDDTVGRRAHGKFELAISKVFPGDQQAAAQRFALDNQQVAIMNLSDPGLEAVSVADEAAMAFKRAELDEVVPSRTARRMERFTELMSPEELERFERYPNGRKVSDRVKNDALRVFSLMPETEQGVGMAMLGAEMAHWYRSSAKTLRAAFGNEAPRFSALLASTSPNIGVPENLGASLQIWRDWNAAGRPLGDKAIQGFINQASNDWGITPTSFNNTKKILGLSKNELLDPKLLKTGGLLSGPKVDPFYANLVGEMQRLVVDTHMKSGFGFARDQVRVPEGIGTNIATRDVANTMTELLGTKVEVADVQAAQWAGIRALRDLQRAPGKVGGTRSAEDIVTGDHFGSLFGIEEGFSGGASLPELRQAISEQPSFSTLIHEDRYKGLVDDLGIELPPATPEVGLSAIVTDADTRFSDVLAFARRMDLRSQKRFLYGAAAAMLGGGAANADAAELGREALAEAGLDAEMARNAPPEQLASFAALLAENPDASMADLQLLGQRLGLDGADAFAGGLGLRRPEFPVDTIAGDSLGVADREREVRRGGLSRIMDFISALTGREEERIEDPQRQQAARTVRGLLAPRDTLP